VVEVAVVTDPGADFGGLVLARVGDAYRLARAILLDDREAEDAVQEASLAAWRRQGSLRDPARFEVWFERILVNQCRDQLRRRKRAVQLAAPPIGFEAAAAPTETGADADLDQAIAALDADHRIVVVMRYWQDRTVEDIAERLGVPAALKRLRSDLEARDGRS
jgi:RNA polymerase sigma-70 factor (ECF subfamily)